MNPYEYHFVTKVSIPEIALWRYAVRPVLSEGPIEPKYAWQKQPICKWNWFTGLSLEIIY